MGPDDGVGPSGELRATEFVVGSDVGGVVVGVDEGSSGLSVHPATKNESDATASAAAER